MLALALSSASGKTSLKALNSVSTQVTPTQKVLSMLQGMLTNGKKEKHTEEINFSAYKQFCEDTAAEKSRLIKEGNNEIEMLTADIAKAQSDAEVLGREIQGHDSDIAAWQTDIADARDIRTAENKDFVATHKDYSESIDALTRAIATLKKQNFNREQVASLIQVLAKYPDFEANEARAALNAFLSTGAQNTPAGTGYSAPQAHAYEFQSGSIIDLLEKLLGKFKEERNDLEKQEANNRHAHELLVQDLTNSVNTATGLRQDKSQQKASKEQAVANGKSELAATTKERDANQHYLDELTGQCKTKASEFQTRQSLRADEITALTQAIDILSQKVTPLAEKHLPTLIQVSRAAAKVGASLLQVSSKAALRATADKDVQEKVAFYLKESAKRIGSHVLSALAVKVSEDPFVKVRKMIQDLIVRLMEEANSEAEHKGWCDTEIKSNEQTRNAKTQQITKLTSEIDQLAADIALLANQIQDLSKAINDLDAAVAKATEVRNVEHAQNTATIKDSQDAQTALAEALTILKEYYAKAAANTALVATPSEDAPITWDTAYHGQMDKNGGVVGFLEVIQSDFARLETETKSDEATAAKEYQEFMSASAVNKMSMTKDVEFKTDKKATTAGKKQSAEADRDGAQKELDAANAYFEKLKPACLESGTTYEDRVSRRKEEIQSLQEALRILNGESA